MNIVLSRAARAAGFAVLATVPLVMAAPAMASAPEGKVNGFKPIERPLTPGERVAGHSYARPGNDVGGQMLGITGDSDGSSRSGVQFSMSGNWAGNGNSFGSRRSNSLLGDGVAAYDAEPFYSNNRGYYYNPSTNSYQSATPRLSYNQSFLRHMYDGNIAGVPSVSAPLEFWNGRR
ncbi:hypothetical protein [Niveispirillum irakense]|uniref:hypothetical protein n=1 Tax=Niveispirillum irakense TaxID=34011 RepID=UPI000420F046|nr:hypothetical protein [Niveispirillum irakense]